MIASAVEKFKANQLNQSFFGEKFALNKTKSLMEKQLEKLHEDGEATRQKTTKDMAQILESEESFCTDEDFNEEDYDETKQKEPTKEAE